MCSEMKQTYEIPAPVDVVWKMTKQAAVGDLLVKIMPTVFTNVETAEGGDGAGTVRVLTFGEGFGPLAGQKGKERVDVLDDATHTYSHSILEGGDPRYKDVQFTVKLSAAGDSTAVDWTAKYTPVDPSAPPPEHLKAMADDINEAMSAYAKEHSA